MKLELHDKENKFLSSLTDDCATLENLGAEDGIIHVNTIGDVSAALGDLAIVEKFSISEDKYEQREDSVRVWRKREGLVNKVDLEKIIAEMKEAAKQFKVGERCIVRLSKQPEKRGTISFIGETKFKPGIWIGVAYDEALGKHDGTVQGVRYFTCEQGHGAFVHPNDIQKCDIVHDEVMEEI